MFNALEMKYLLSKKLRKETQRGQSGTSWSSVIQKSTSLLRKTIQKIEITWTCRGLCLKGMKTLNKRNL